LSRITACRRRKPAIDARGHRATSRYRIFREHRSEIGPNCDLYTLWWLRDGDSVRAHGLTIHKDAAALSHHRSSRAQKCRIEVGGPFLRYIKEYGLNAPQGGGFHSPPDWRWGTQSLQPEHTGDDEGD